MNVRAITRVLWAWMAVMAVAMSQLPFRDDPFFRAGPGPELVIFGAHIDTAGKYLVVVAYTCINTVVRAFQTEILNSWITNNVYDEKTNKTAAIRALAYQANVVRTVYIWFDFLMYMNILLTQIDLFLFETIGHVATSFYTTRYYLAQGPVALTTLPTDCALELRVLGHVADKHGVDLEREDHRPLAVGR